MADRLNGLSFSEFLLDNPSSKPGFDTDGDGQHTKSDEYIELQNTSGSPLSLDGYEVWSDDRGLLYSFGAGDTIAPGATATIVGEYAGTPPAGFYDAGKGEGTNWLQDGEGTNNDNLYLVDTATGEFIAFSYGETRQPYSPPTGFPGASQIGAGEYLASGAPNGTAFTRDAGGQWTEAATGAYSPGTPGVVCFAAGTLILTPDGERRVEDLRVGDLVSTRDSGAQRILWMSSRALGPDALEAQPELRPVVLEARWTGSGQRILLSPQHAVLVMTSRFPDGRLVRAAQLARSRGGAVRVAQGVRHVTFHHFMLPRHEIVYANGMAAESFFPGSRAVGALEPSDRLTLLELFPGHAHGELAAAYGGPRVPYARSRDLPNDLSGLSPDRVPALSGPGIVSAQKAAVADRSSAPVVPSRSPERLRG